MRVPTIAAAILAITAASPAVALRPVPANEPGLRHVSYADLDLATDAGVQSLFHRVHRAGRSVCESNAGPDLLRRSSEQMCFDMAMTDAASQIERAVAKAIELKADRALATGDQ
jgi:UrcA family protein